MTVEFGDQRQTAPRDSSDSGVLARVPAEPAGVLLALAGGRDVEVLGTEDLDGTETTRLRTTVDPQAAVEAGLGTQAQLSIAQLPSLPLEARLGADGLPRRVVYRAEVPSLQEGRNRVLVGTYDYAGWASRSTSRPEDDRPGHRRATPEAEHTEGSGGPGGPARPRVP